VRFTPEHLVTALCSRLQTSD